MRYRRLFLLVAAVGIIAAACSSSDQADTVAPTTEATVTETSDTTAPAGATGDLVAQDGDTVEVHYVGTLDDGSQFDSSRDRGVPFSFTVGTGQVISGFDEAVRGAQVGETNTVRMEAADAYGEWSEENVLDLPYDPAQGEVAVGESVTLSNGQPAEVLEVTADTVKLDANHPLAGEALTFEIEVLGITRP
ncbi:MAG: peptidylprolyl isomerase [Actinomycetota bacterium]